MQLLTVCGKLGYATHGRAMNALRSTRKTNWRRGDESPLHVYRCPECGDWHVGHVNRWGTKYNLKKRG